MNWVTILLSKVISVLCKGHNKYLRRQTIDQIMAKPVDVVKYHEKTKSR